MIKFSRKDFKFSLETLKILLKSWRGHTSLSILTSDADYEKEEYMEIVDKYKNDEVIEDFKCNVQYYYFFNHEMMM